MGTSSPSDSIRNVLIETHSDDLLTLAETRRTKKKRRGKGLSSPSAAGGSAHPVSPALAIDPQSAPNTLLWPQSKLVVQMQFMG